jgi:hypothetical protein
MSETDMNEFFTAINGSFANIGNFIGTVQIQANPIGQLLSIIFMLAMIAGLTYLIFKMFTR